MHGPGVDASAPTPSRPGNSDLCFVWDGPIAGAVEHLAACGVRDRARARCRGGARGDGQSVYFRDPDGTLLSKLISYA